MYHKDSVHKKLRAWAHELPKIALHRHLEGSLRVETMAQIALESKIKLPAYDVEKLRPYVQITDDPADFHHYIGKFRLLRNFYVSKSVIQRVVREAILDATQDNVFYLEIRFNPIALSKVYEFALADVVNWVMEAVTQMQEVCDTRVCLILQIEREGPLSVAQNVVDIAIERHGDLVRAIDLAGDEVNYPPELFKEPFRRAKRAGLHITAHAGEAMGPESVRSAVINLEAERIGHGIRSIEDPEVVRLVADRGVVLEVCPTSNFQTGVVRVPAQHPLRELFNQGIRVTVNTDNPSISATTVSNEYVVSIQDVGLEPWMIYQTLRTALEAAFIPDAERPALRQRIYQALAPYPEAQAKFEAD